MWKRRRVGKAKRSVPPNAAHSRAGERKPKTDQTVYVTEIGRAIVDPRHDDALETGEVQERSAGRNRSGTNQVRGQSQR
jgi:hypothetical protein